MTREDLLEAFGQPESRLQMGNREILSFPGGARVEMVDGEVVEIRGNDDALVVDRDGNRHAVGSDGKLMPLEDGQALVPVAPEAPEPSAGAQATDDRKEDAQTPPEPPGEPAGQTLESEEPAAERPRENDASEEASQEGRVPQPEQAEDYVEPAELFEEEPLPSWAGPVSVVLGFVFRFVIVVIVLRITLGWIGQPFIYRDVLRTGFLYTAIRDSMHALGGLGEGWQMIQIFRVDEAISFIALAVLIYRSGIARTGITALKIAVGTKIASIFLMLGVGVAISFVLLALAG